MKKSYDDWSRRTVVEKEEDQQYYHVDNSVFRQQIVSNIHFPSAMSWHNSLLAATLLEVGWNGMDCLELAIRARQESIVCKWILTQLNSDLIYFQSVRYLHEHCVSYPNDLSVVSIWQWPWRHHCLYLLSLKAEFAEMEGLTPMFAGWNRAR